MHRLHDQPSDHFWLHEPGKFSGHVSPTGTGLYQFTLEGAGNAEDTNTFAVTGGTVISGTPLFTVVGPGGTGAGSTPNGTSFIVSLPNGDIPFTLTNTTTGCSIVDSAASTPTGNCNYLIALGNSPTSPGALGPQDTAWIGFSDSPP